MADRIESLMSLLGGDVSVRWLITLLHFLWQGAVVGVAVVIAARLLRRASARPRYALYSAALVSLPFCVAVTFCVVDVPASLQSNSRPESPAEASVTPSELSRQALPAKPAVPTATTEATKSPVPSEPFAGNAATMTAVADDPSESPLRSSLSHSSLALLSRAAPWIAAAYFLGVACFLLRLSTALWGGHRLRSRTARVTDAKLLRLIADQADRVRLKCVPIVAYCERVAVPTVLGVLRPMVLLPAALMTGLTPDDFAAIIRHELAHIRRYDLWMNLLQRVIESLLFFHPVVWLISRRLNAEREVCCDDLVVSSGYEPMHYAGALLRMAELCAFSRQPAALALAAAGDRTPLLERRIERLMNWSNGPRLQLTRAGMAGLLLALVSLILMPGVARTWAQPPAKEVAPVDQAKEGSGVQPVRADSTQADVRTLLKPAYLLPDRWRVVAVGFDNDSTELVTVSSWHLTTVHRWDVVGRKLNAEAKLTSDEHGRSFTGLTLSADCRRAVAATDKYVGIWDTRTGKILKMLPIPTVDGNNTVHLFACTPDLSVIAASLGTPYLRTTMVYDAHAVVWDVASGKILSTITHEHANDFGSLALSPDGKRLATTNGGGAVIWETSTGRQLHVFPNDNSNWKRPDIGGYNRLHDAVFSLQFSPNGKQLALGDMISAKLLDAESGELLHRFAGPGHWGCNLAFSKDGQRLARLGVEKAVPIWSTQTGKKLFELRTESKDGAFSDDGRWFAVGFEDRKMSTAVWQLSGSAAGAGQRDEATSEADKLRVTEVEPWIGTKVTEIEPWLSGKAAGYVDVLKPAWGQQRLGIQYALALNSTQRQFRAGERIPMTVFLRNASDKTLYVDTHPDYFWNMPKVVNAKGETVEIEKVPLLGISHSWREPLKPGEAFGPLHFALCLGENPRPGKQDWYPRWKTPSPGKYKLTHVLAINVADPAHVADPSHGGASASDGWKDGEVTSGQIEFEIVDAGKP